MKYKISIICISLRPGGTERIVSRVANFLERNYEVSVILLSSASPFYPLNTGVTLVQPSLPARSRAGAVWYVGMTKYLWRSLGKARPDIVLCFGEAIAPAVITLARLRATGVFVFNRASPLSSLRGVRGVVNPLTYPLAEKIVVQTYLSTKLMRRRYMLSRFSVLPNPIDMPSSVRPIKERSPLIINVGSLGGRKNQRSLMRVFSRLERTKGWSLEFVGDGPDRTALEKFSEGLKTSDTVHFLGHRSDVSDLLQNSPIFAFTSLTEGFPNALAEAMAAGCACISYDCPTGPAELIDHGVNGFLVSSGDEFQYLRLLQRLIDDGQLRETFSRNARESMKQFEASAVLSKLERMIESTIEGK